MRRLETFDWWPSLLGVKDELSLRELAERFDVTPGAISAALKRGGIIRQPAPPGPRVHRREARDELPPEPGNDDVRIRPGSKDSRLVHVLHLVGKVPDSEVAAQAGVSTRTVASFRNRNGIVGYRGPRTSRTTRQRSSKIDPFGEMVGTVPDRVVAEQAGVTINAVRNYRVKRGIVAARRRANGVTTSVRAWQVSVENGKVVGVVIASDLAQACQLAQSMADGEVQGLRCVGAVLNP
jgi:hypothetical protein